jgi:hypothetical protein
MPGSWPTTTPSQANSRHPLVLGAVVVLDVAVKEGREFSHRTRVIVP